MQTVCYARYSSDLQSPTSIDDQLRNIRAHCARMGWPAPTVYADREISGSRTDRDGYAALLRDASRYDIVLFDDLTRLGRDNAELQRVIRCLKFAGVRVIGVSDGIDTDRKGHKLEVGLRGLMGELYLDDLAEKTHRGQTGIAMSGASAGGLPYGYRVTTRTQRAIDPEQADIVRRIYREYLAGHSPRQIAADLNRDGIPSPRGSTWAVSAIYGDRKRGIGILANPIYAGRQIWNRSEWIKHPDTGRRIRRDRPESEWITREIPELAIITPAEWAAVQAKGTARSRDTAGNRKQGRPPSHLLSGILRCGDCGGPMVRVDRYRYGCATAKDRGTCTSRLRIASKIAEDALLAGIRQQLLSDDAYRRFLAAVTAALKTSAPDTTRAERDLDAAKRVHANIMTALRAGIITPSTRTELIAAEAAVTRAEEALAQARNFAPAQALPRAKERWHNIVARLAEATRNIPAAREAIHDLLGPEIRVINDNGQPVAELAACQISMVAGACFDRYLTETLRIPLTTGAAGLPDGES